jgi:hypothetical protein
MIERAPYGIIESDEKGTIVRANLEANGLLGRQTTSSLGRISTITLSIRRHPSLKTVRLSMAGFQRFVRKDGSADLSAAHIDVHLRRKWT